MNNNPGHVVSGIVDCLNLWHGNNCTVLQYIVYAHKPHTPVTQPHHRSLSSICAKIFHMVYSTQQQVPILTPLIPLRCNSWYHGCMNWVSRSSPEVSLIQFSHMVIYLTSHISPASSFGLQWLWYHSRPHQCHHHQQGQHNDICLQWLCSVQHGQCGKGHFLCGHRRHKCGDF